MRIEMSSQIFLYVQAQFRSMPDDDKVVILVSDAIEVVVACADA
jgi:hypothetical protein